MSRPSESFIFETLIVDDDRVVSLLHKNHIRQFHPFCSPVMCYDGKEALEYLRGKDGKGKSFLIFLDLNMPVINGWEFLEEVHRSPLLGTLTIIIVTSSVDSEDECRAMKYKNVISFCRKPLTEQSIRHIVSLEEFKLVVESAKLSMG